MSSKKILLLLILLLSIKGYSTGKAIITGIVNSETAVKIFLAKPINGINNRLQVFEKNLYLTLPSKKILINEAFNIDLPTVVYVYVFSSSNKILKRADLIIEPSDSIHFSADPNLNEYKWITFTGSNASGHDLFNKKEYDLYSKYIPFFDILKNLKIRKTNILYDIDSLVQVQQHDFNKLYTEKKISKKFYETIKTYYQLAYVDKLISMLPRKYNETGRLSKATIVEIVLSALKKISPFDPKLAGLPQYVNYKKNYYAFLEYRKPQYKFAEEIEVKNQKILTAAKKYKIDSDMAFYSIVSDTLDAQLIFSDYILSCLIYAPGDCGENEINAFEENFPKSEWLQILKKQNLFLDTKPPAIFKQQSEIVKIPLLKNYNSIEIFFKEIVNKKFAFVDIWASWCVPCISAFENNIEVDSFLLAHDVQKIYLSVDENSKAWETAIEKYKLGGYHYLSDSLFLNNIKRPFGLTPQESLSIPRYLIVKKTGEIIDYNPPYPGSEAFYSIFLKLLGL